MSPAKIGIIGLTSPELTGASNALCCGFEPAQELPIIRSYPLPSPCFTLINTICPHVCALFFRNLSQNRQQGHLKRLYIQN
jgi:hypothetical protein